MNARHPFASVLFDAWASVQENSSIRPIHFQKVFQHAVQSAVNARPQRDESQNSSVDAETMTLLANSSCGHQMMVGSQYTVTKNLNDENLRVQ